MEKAEKYMWRCMELARNGVMHAAPNPMVGAVVVCDDQIIGEGYHARCGEAHAEVNAIASVKDKSMLMRSTIYVSLEPCSHYGKTPPCADLIISMKIPRVVIGCQDPFSEVAGRGIQRLRDAGCEVIVGVLEKECRHLIRRFITFNTLQRPYVLLKWAESIDGFIDYKREDGQAVRLSNDFTSMRVHQMRAEAKAILVGTNTARLDNPSLTVRHWYGENPLRIVIDKELKLKPDLALFDGSVETLVFTCKTKESRPGVTYITAENHKPLLPQIMAELYRRKIQSLMIEGGTQLLQSFIDEGLWDEAFIEKSQLQINEGVKAPVLYGEHCFDCSTHFGHSVLHYTRCDI